MTAEDRQRKLDLRLVAYAIAAGAGAAVSTSPATAGGALELAVTCQNLEIVVDLQQGTVTVNGTPLQLSPAQPFDIDVDNDGTADFFAAVESAQPGGFANGLRVGSQNPQNQILVTDPYASFPGKKLRALAEFDTLYNNDPYFTVTGYKSAAYLDTNANPPNDPDADFSVPGRFVGFSFVASGGSTRRLGFARVQFDTETGIVRINEFGFSEETAPTGSFFITIDCPELAAQVAKIAGGCATEPERDPVALAPLGVLALVRRRRDPRSAA